MENVVLSKMPSDICKSMSIMRYADMCLIISVHFQPILKYLDTHSYSINVFRYI